MPACLACLACLHLHLPLPLPLLHCLILSERTCWTLTFSSTEVQHKYEGTVGILGLSDSPPCSCLLSTVYCLHWFPASSVFTSTSTSSRLSHPHDGAAALHIGSACLSVRAHSSIKSVNHSNFLPPAAPIGSIIVNVRPHPANQRPASSRPQPD